MGAKKTFACDIDPEALSHAEKNGRLNGVEIHFNLPESFSQKPIVLMNMIASEQTEAWKENGCDFDVLITSGILKSAKETYLQFASSNDWKLIEERELDGWLGFIFQSKEE